MPTVTVQFLPLDPHIHAALVRTPEAVHIGVDPSDPEAASAALTKLLQQLFDEGDGGPSSTQS